MAKTEVGLSVDIEFQSIGQMRKAIKEATGDLIAMSEKFGTSSKEAIEAARRVADLKDRLGDAKALADTFNPDKKFVALGGALEGATAGFTTLQGAMGLFGGASEDLEKMLLKVQSAMALQQGISGIAGAMDSFKMLAGEVQKSSIFMKANAVSTELASGAMKMFGVSVNTTSTSFKVLKGAIVATGIGALVVAIGYAVDAMMDWYDSTNKQALSTEQLKKREEELKNEIDKTNDAIERRNQISNYSAQLEINNAKAKGKSAKELRDLEMKFALEARGRAQDEEEAARKRLNYAENLSTAEKAILEKDLADKIKAREDAFQKERLLESEHKIAIYEENKSANEKLKGEIDKNNKERQDAEKSYTEFLKNEKDNQSKIGLSDRDKELKELQLKYDQQIAIAKKYGFDTSELLRLQKEQEAAINAKYDKQIQDNTEKSITDNAKRTKELQDQLRLSAITDQKEREKVDRELQLQSELDAETERYKNGEVRLEQYLFNLALIRQKYANDEKLRLEADAKDKAKIEEDFNKQRIDAEIAVQNATFDAASAGLNAMEMLAGENKKLANAFFVIDKALAIVKIIVDTQREIASYYAAGAASPTNILAPGSGMVIATQQAIAAKIRAGISIATIAATTIGKFTSGGGGANVPAPAAPPPIAATLPPTATAQLVNAQAINNMGNQATRAYVLNSDIQNNDQRNAYLQRNARLG